MITFESIVQLDKDITLWINNLSATWNDAFWWALSDIGFWIPMYIAIAAFALWKLGWKKGLAVILSAVLTLILIDQGSNLVKSSVARLRPCYDTWMVNNGLRLPYGILSSGKFGFFSAHAGNTFGFAIVSYLGLKWNTPQSRFWPYGVFIFLWAVFVSFSRLMMGAHFLGDILVGSVVGLAVGWFCAFLARRIVVKANL